MITARQQTAAPTKPSFRLCSQLQPNAVLQPSWNRFVNRSALSQIRKEVTSETWNYVFLINVLNLAFVLIEFWHVGAGETKNTRDDFAQRRKLVGKKSPAEHQNPLGKPNLSSVFDNVFSWLFFPQPLLRGKRMVSQPCSITLNTIQSSSLMHFIMCS